MEALVNLAANGEPVIGDKDSDYYMECFINDVIEYHNNLENESPTKYVVFYFYETDDITVVQKTVDILKRKENEVIRPRLYFYHNIVVYVYYIQLNKM